jgi:hypothetical protein
MEMMSFPWMLFVINKLTLVGIVWCHAVSQDDANVSEIHTLSIFRAEVTKLGNGGLI